MYSNVRNSNDEKNFLKKLLITNAKVSKLCKALPNNSSANIKLSKTKDKPEGFLGSYLGKLLKPGLPLIGNELKPLAKSILIPLGLGAAPATDASIHKKMFGSGVVISVLSNEKINDIMKIIKYLEESGLLIKPSNYVSQRIKNEVK